MQRSLLFVGLCIAGLVFPWWIFLCCVLVYAFRYTAYEAIMLGALLDAYVGVALPILPVPVFYLLATLVIVFCSEWIKPYLAFGER